MQLKSNKKNKEYNETSAEEVLQSLITDYTVNQIEILKLKRDQVNKEEFLESVKEHISKYYNISDEIMEEAEKLFEQYVFGYYRLTPLIDNPEISDIRCLTYDSIRIKKNGRRMDSGVRFQSLKEYKSFIEFVAIRNQVNVSNLNAIQRFTDNKSHPDYILRFTVTMPLVNTYDQPYMHIRKVPRNFPDMQILIQKSVMPKDLADTLIRRFREGSTIICGGNSSGKTTILNALKETLPENKSIMIAQQADELTTKNHPDMMFLHSLPGTSESQVSYDLKDISIAGLTMDVDYFIIGEVKGSEAMYLINAAYTGQICAATIHAPSADRAIDKVVDYAMYNSRYSRKELLKMLSCFETVIFMEDYHVSQVFEVSGWDRSTEEIQYIPIYERKK